MAKRKPKSKKAYNGDYVPKKKPSASNLLEVGVSEKSWKKFLSRQSKEEKVREFLSIDQKKQLAKYVQYYTQYANDKLKEILTINRQAKTGSRTDLLNRCAEGKMLGGLRNCPKCKGGNLNFNLKTGEYFCKGFEKSCNYQSSTAERNPWVEE